ncbi:MAG: lysophospholipid acyltransferase family protein [Candidatus Neomarinimicrobiota bacterium]
MLYTLIRLVAILSLERFFHNIVVEHRERVPKNRPTIFVANHPNTMIDAMLVGYAVGKRIHFLAKGTLFTNRIASWLLGRMGLVPLYRYQDDPAQMLRNEEVFRRLYDHLRQGGSFLIFPEGTSEPERRLQRIKTGAARIAFGAENEYDFRLGVHIVPVGLNYSDYEKFRSDAYCRFGHAIIPGELKREYEKDPTQAVRSVTNRIKVNLEKLTTYLPEDGLAETVSNLERIYKKELMVDLGMKLKSMKDDFLATKGIIRAVEWFYHNQRERVEQIQKRIATYLRNLERLHIRDEFLSPRRSGLGFRKRLKAWLLMVLGFPLYLWGTINNFIPYILPRWYVNRFVDKKTFVSSVKLLVGLGSFVIFFSLQSWFTWHLFHARWITILYAISLIPSGNFALYYFRKASNYRQHMIFLSLFYRRRNLVYDLIQQRMELIESLNRARDEYLAATRTVFRPS